jgi:hypothetical protein
MRNRRAVVPCLIATACLVLAVTAARPAATFDTKKLGQWGTLAPEDEANLLAKSPRLKTQFQKAAATIGKKPEEIPCWGQRFPGSWKNLGGTRVAPYTCMFGNRKLLINAKVSVKDKHGKVYETISPAAMKEAKAVDESHFVWSWSG